MLATQSKFPERKQYQLAYTKPNWNKIQQCLITLRDKQSKDFKDLSILLVKLYTINKDYKIQYQVSFDALKTHKFQKLQTTFSKIAGFVLDQKQLYTSNQRKRFYLMVKEDNFQQEFTKSEVVLLMCLSALGINSVNFKQQQGNRQSYHDEVNFIFMYTIGRFINKVPWILNYFQTVLNSQYFQNNKHLKMSIVRSSIIERKISDLQLYDKTLNKLTVIEKGSIQDYVPHNTLKIDFANKFIGGGSLGSGCVQQEIMFLNHPQLYITMLFCQVMNPNQAIGMHGFKKYWKNTGYADTTTFNDIDETMNYVTEQNYLNDYIVAIDAVCRPKKQYSQSMILREINKSLVGFNLYDNVKKISTGNWGCGAFGGDPQLKFIIQWISASIVGKEVSYFTFENKKMANVAKVAELLEGKKVSDVLGYLLKFEDQCEKTVFQYIEAITEGENKIVEKL